mmetsp:Transcript_96940/g.167224  ORF Transcript_96940/g.167224 Transcript_96940/m.167224 type:complete len:87 (-) Transcript_96940:94-354(-)
MNHTSHSVLGCVVFYCFTPVGVESLALLKKSTVLRSLSLILCNTWIQDCGAVALATLNEAPAMHTLNLDLSWENLIAWCTVSCSTE